MTDRPTVQRAFLPLATGWRRRGWLGAVLALPCLGGWAQTSLSFGVVPQTGVGDLLQRWQPVLQWLSAHAGLKLEFATAPDISTFEQRLAAQSYDVAYMNPYHFVEFNARPGYRALARARNTRLEGIVVVHKHSSYQTLRDLQGLTLAFPAPASFGATLLVAHELQRNGIAFQRRFVKSHNSVYRTVAQGFYPAGGGVPDSLALMEPAIREQLRVLWRSPAFTPHAFATRPGLDEITRQKLWQAMQAMTSDSEGRRLLEAIGFQHGFEAGQDRDWNDVRQLRIAPEHSGIRH